ncbi:MAG: 2-dehydro-3-deoxygalactonokinase [Pseudomonadota bacterium]
MSGAAVSIAPDRIVPDWIAVDWGTSNCRAWAMGAAGRVLAQARSDAGMGALRPDQFEPALLSLIGGWLGTGPVDVIACGMVGARQGWAEAPYRPVPCRPDALMPVDAPATDPRLRVRLVPGLRQDAPADVMRGEEIQIAGFLTAEPEFDGVLCLPGTHTKWVRVSAGEVVGFITFMTGELFALLAAQSVLRHALGTASDEAAFAAGVAEGMARPEALAARLFGIRAEALLSGLAPSAARGRLSGLLIGAELAGARGYWLGQDLRVIGDAGLAPLYAQALGAQGVPAPVIEGDAMTLRGLSAVMAQLVRA